MRSIVSSRMIQIRKEYGLTQSELGDKLGVSKSAIGSWENDERTPEIPTLLHICEVFKVPIQWFFIEDTYVKLDPYALVISDAREKQISPEQLKHLIAVLSKQK